MARSDHPVNDETSAELGSRLRFALELAHTGVVIMRQNLRREHPHATPEEIERLLDAWLSTRPGAEAGDGVGHPVDRFGTSRCPD
jgi:hypothetical protein